MGGTGDAEERRIRLARAALVGALAVYGVVAVTVLIAGPEVIAGQIGIDGRPRRLDPTGPFVLILTVSVIAFVALFVAMPRIVLKAPLSILNVPRRMEWDSPAGRRMLARLVASDMLFIAAATVLLMAAMLVISALGGFGVVLPGWVIALVMVPYFVYVIGFAIAAYRGTRYVPPVAD